MQSLLFYHSVGNFTIMSHTICCCDTIQRQYIVNQGSLVFYLDFHNHVNAGFADVSGFDLVGYSAVFKYLLQFGLQFRVSTVYQK